MSTKARKSIMDGNGSVSTSIAVSNYRSSGGVHTTSWCADVDNRYAHSLNIDMSINTVAYEEIGEQEPTLSSGNKVLCPRGELELM